MLIKLLLSFLWLVLVPVGVGMNLSKGLKKGNTLGNAYLLGYLVMFAVTELLALPVIFFRHLSLTQLSCLWGGLMGALALAGYWRNRRTFRHLPDAWKNISRDFSVYLAAALLVIGIQAVISMVMVHYDADDAFFLGTAVTDVYHNSVFQIDPYTGDAYTSLPVRYVLSPFPVFNEIISTLSGGVHPAVTAHMVFPGVFLMAAYAGTFHLGKAMYPGDRKASGLFLLFVSVIQMCSCFSIYTSGTFMMTRIWQGKAVLAAVILPAICYLGLLLGQQKGCIAAWIAMLCAMMAGCFVSTMGVMLCPIAMGVFLIREGIWERDWRFAGKGLLCCIPCAVIAGLYLLLSYGG